MKPTPSPPNPKLIDRVEYALQWAASWIIVDIKGHPMISGLCTGFLMIIPISGPPTVCLARRSRLFPVSGQNCQDDRCQRPAPGRADG
jgi:hypothetical protein